MLQNNILIMFWSNFINLHIKSLNYTEHYLIYRNLIINNNNKHLEFQGKELIYKIIIKIVKILKII